MLQQCKQYTPLLKNYINTAGTREIISQLAEAEENFVQAKRPCPLE
jgi:hypothetical protein